MLQGTNCKITPIIRITLGCISSVKIQVHSFTEKAAVCLERIAAGRPPDKPVWLLAAPGEASIVISYQERTQYLRNAHSQRDNHTGETSYSACVVYTKTIIHFCAGVGERDGYLIKLTIDIVD